MSRTRRNTLVIFVLLVLVVGFFFNPRGCQPDGKPVASVPAAVMPPAARQPTAAESARPGQIYYHRDTALAKILPGEGLVTKFPDFPAGDLHSNYQIQSDRLSPDVTRIVYGKAVIRQIGDHFGSFPPDALFVRWIDKPDPGKLLLRIGSGEIHHFVWSPDGARVALVTWHPELGTRNLVFDIASQQVEEARLPTYHVDGKEQTMAIAAWAPDGKQMLVIDDGWLYLIPIEQQNGVWSWTGRKRVTADKQAILSPTCAFSPDGAHVAFVTIEKGSIVMALHVVPAEGGEQRTLVPAGNLTDIFPAWSPDSRKVAYSAAHLDVAGERAGRSGIYTIEIANNDPQPSPVLEEVHPPPVLRLRLVDWR